MAAAAYAELADPSRKDSSRRLPEVWRAQGVDVRLQAAQVARAVLDLQPAGSSALMDMPKADSIRRQHIARSHCEHELVMLPA